MARDIIQNCDLGTHKVHNFLSLGGPQMGIQQKPVCENEHLCNIIDYVEDNLLSYRVVQDMLAPAAYWRNTVNQEKFNYYLLESAFLAPMNNEV